MPYFTSLPELVSSQRLDLIPIPLHVLELVRDRHRDALDEAFCMAVAPTWMDGMEGHAALWLQRKQDTSIDPSWLARAIILRDARIIIGHMGFHFPPDARGMVEIGYTVEPGYRRMGIAREGAFALAGAAADAGATVLRASVSPRNLASLGVIAKLGLAEAGSQEDEKDGTELVFEASLPLSRSEPA